VLMGYGESDPEGKAYLSGFMHRLTELGWTDGRNVRIDVRWASGNVDRMGIFAKELVALQPATILTSGTAVTTAVHRETQTITIVFTIVGDPVGDGFVTGLPRPGGNLTGFASQEAAMGGKWLDLLTEIAPGATRIAIMFNPKTAPGGGSYFWPSFEAAARSLKVEPITAPVNGEAEIEMVMTSLGSKPGGGLVVMPENFTSIHRARIISAAARHKVPAIYGTSVLARDGGSLSYGPDYSDMFRRAAQYVNLILGGPNLAEIPVKVPVKFELVINLKTAKTLSLEVPPMLLVRADEVIE